MKSKKFRSFGIVLLAVVLALPLLSSCAESLRDIREDITARRLEGRWYLNGDRSKLCEIFSTGGSLQARNEHGDTTPLVYDGRGSITATNWEGGLRGDVQRDTIRWANGSTWTR